METYAELFGRENIELVDFKKALNHPEGIIGKFCDIIELNDRVRPNLINTEIKNESISYEAAILIDKINEENPLVTNNRITPGRWKGDIEPFKRIKGLKFRLPIDKSLYNIVAEKENESLKYLKEKFSFEFGRTTNTVQFSQEEAFGQEAIASTAFNLFGEIQLLNARLFLEKGRHALTKCNYSKAIEYLKISAHRKPDFSEPYYYLSIAYRHLDDINKALEEAKKALSLSPGDKRFQKNFAELKKQSKI